MFYFMSKLFKVRDGYYINLINIQSIFKTYMLSDKNYHGINIKYFNSSSTFNQNNIETLEFNDQIKRDETFNEIISKIENK